MKKRILAFLLTLVMLIGLLPMTAWAENDEALPGETVEEQLSNVSEPLESPEEEEEEVEQAAEEQPEEKIGEEKPEPAEPVEEEPTEQIEPEPAMLLSSPLLLGTDFSDWTESTNAGGTLNGGNYRLLVDVTLTNSLTISGNVTLDLNGHVLKGNGTGSVISVSGNLTIQDSNSTATHYFTYNKNGKWTLNTTASSGIGLSAITDSTTDGTVIELTGGCITGGNGGTTTGGGVTVIAGGKLVMSGGNIVGNTTAYSGGGGGGVMLAGGSYNTKFEMSGTAKIIGNTVTNGRGGGVFAGGYSSMTMTGGEIAYNYANGNSGGADNGGGGVMTNGSFTMTNGKIHHNVIAAQAGNNPGMGGGVYRCRADNDRGATTLGGTAQITDNFVGNTPSNLYLDEAGNHKEKFVTLSTTTPPTTGFSVGVTISTGTGEFVTTGGTAVNAKYFFSDASDKSVVFDNTNSSLKLAAGHIHDGKTFAAWNYTESLPTESGSWYLTNDVTLTNQWLPAEGTTNLCLNGHVITLNGTGGGNNNISINLGATLNLYDCGTAEHKFTVDANGLWTLNESATENYETVTGGVITGGNNGTGGAIYLSWSNDAGVTGAMLNMYGGNIVGNKATGNGGGAVYVDRPSTFNMSGGKIIGNIATKNGGAVYLHTENKGRNVTFNMSGGEIRDNKAAEFGGGVYVESNIGTFNMSGGTIAGCSAQKGGGVYTWGNMTMSGNSAIQDCKATIDGGGVCACNCAFSMTGNSVVSECVANNGGGGVYTWAGEGLTASFTMSGTSKIEKCVAEYTDTSNLRSGGGLCVENSTFTMTGGAITDNTSADDGGGVCFMSGTTTLGGTAKITDNVKGGTISGGTLTGGTANNLYLYSGKTVTLGTSPNAPAEGMSVGVTMQTADQFTASASGAAAAKGCFTSDSAAYTVNLNKGTNAEQTTDDYLELAAIYAVTNGAPSTSVNDNHGYLTIDKTTAIAGETVTLTVTPESGYQLKANSFKVFKTDESTTTVNTSGSGSTYTFTMPAYAVTVTAEFEEVPHTHSFTYEANSGTITATCADTDGKCGLTNKKVTLTLTAPASLVYDGNAKSFTFADGEAATWKAAVGSDAPTIEYWTTGTTPAKLEGAPANAGTYTAKVTVDTDKTATLEFTIAKATPDVTVPTAKTDLTYTAQAQALINAGSIGVTTADGSGLEYALGTGDGAAPESGWGVSVPTGTGAGTYYVWYRWETTNYNGVAAACIPVTIAKATVTAPTISSKAYTGGTLTADVATSTLYTVTTNNGGTEVGEYNVVLTLSAPSNYKWTDSDAATKTLTFQITKADNSWTTEPAIADVTYGTAISPAGAAKFGEVTITYVGTNNTTYEKNTTAPTNAGTYTATFSVATTNNYDGLTKDVTFTIAQKEVGLTWLTLTEAQLVYNKTAKTLTATATGLVGGDTCNVTVALTTGKDNINVGKFTFTATALSNPNYALPTGVTSPEYEITPKEVGLTWSTPTETDLVYSRTAKTLTATATGVETDDTCNVTVALTTEKNNINVGAFTFTASALDNPNYKLPADTQKVTSPEYTITPKQLTVTGTTVNATKVYDGNKTTAVDNNGTLDGVCVGDTVTHSATATYADKNVGENKTVTVVYAISGTNAGNYIKPADNTSLKAAITQKQLEVSGTTVSGKTYDGNTTASVTPGTLTGDVNGDVVTLSATATYADKNVGENKSVTVVYTISGDDAANYIEPVTDSSFTATITAKQLTATGTTVAATKVYNSYATAAVMANGSLGGVESGDTVTFGTVTATYADKDVGIDKQITVKYTISGADAGNYIAPVNNTSLTANITPKPITAQWTSTSKVYNGMAQGPGYTLLGVCDGDTIAVTNTKTDAGSYQLIATLNSANYTLTNPNVNFVIEKAPVTFTVADDSQQYDGNAKTATITAKYDKNSNFTAFTTTYKNSRGETVAQPTAVGNYGVYVKITNDNYRHADAADGAERKIGTLSIYQTSAPATYTVSFDGNGATGGKTDALDAVKAGNTRTLPECGFAKAGWTFTGWKYGNIVYRAGESFTQPASNVTFTAQWTDKSYTASGTTTANAVIKLMSGDRQVGETKTADANGAFSFSGVLPGLYNLVVSYDGKTVTSAVEISDANVTNLTVTLPGGKTNSVVEVAAGTPEVVVGGLEQSFAEGAVNYNDSDKSAVSGGGSVEIKLEVSEISVPEEEKQTELAKKSSNEFLYLDMDLSKTTITGGGISTTTPLYSSDPLLEITVPIPADIQGKDSYQVYRYHKENAEADEELTQMKQLSGTDTPMEEGYRVSQDKTTVTVYTRSFSLYAITYQQYSGGGSSSYAVTVESAKNGTVSADKKNTYSGNTVTITVAPDKGYTLETLTVLNKNGKEVEVKNLGNNKFSFKMPSSKVTVSATFMEDNTMLNFFVDVKATDYYYDAVLWAAENDITNGVDATHFGPASPVTRAQVVTFLWRAAGCPEAEHTAAVFKDVSPDAYYVHAVEWALSEGITKGTSETTFSPDKVCTRGQIVTFLARFAGVEDEATGYTHGFTDVKAADYFNNAVAWAKDNKVTEGTTPTTFSPNTDCTRAQVVTFLYRWMIK